MTEIYERQDTEPNNWYSRFLLYRGMGASRTLLGAVHLAEKSGKKRSKKVPGAWDAIFEKWNWRGRSDEYDAHVQAEQEAREAAYRAYEDAERERLLSTGLALAEKRVEALEGLYALIKKSFLDAETHELAFKFVTADKIREARGCLDDIAKEVGGRVKKDKVEHSGSVEFRTEWGGGRLEESEEV